MNDKQKKAHYDLRVRWSSLQGRLGSAREIIEKVLRVCPTAGVPTMEVHFPKTREVLLEILEDLSAARLLMDQELDAAKEADSIIMPIQLKGTDLDPATVNFLVESCDSYTHMKLVTDLNDRYPGKVDQRSMLPFFKVGMVGEMPVVLQFSRCKIDDFTIVFYEATSKMVDWDMIHKWLKREFGDTPETNPMNFGHCMHAIDDHLKQKDPA